MRSLSARSISSLASASTGIEEADARIADRELRGVHADGDAAGAGGDVIARQRALPPLVESALGIERERMRGNRQPAPQ